MKVLESVNSILEHVKAVEADVTTMSKESQMKMVQFLESQNLTITDEVAEAMQYQDIIAQQLSATIEAIETTQKSLALFLHAFTEDEDIATSSVIKLEKKLEGALEQARNSQQSFSGKLKQDDDEDGIEFF